MTGVPTRTGGGSPVVGPGRHRRPPRRSVTLLRAALTAVAVTAGTVAVVSGTGGGDAPVPAAAAAPPAPVVLTSPVADTVAEPVRVTVPAIGLDTDLVGIGVDAAGALLPPADSGQAGWFSAGPAPGDVGPAVLAGHVDSTAGPAVFFRLEELSPGDEVLVTRSDGRRVAFTVTEVAAYPKTAFPTTEVYGPTTGAELRLITCGGSFDRSRRSYTDNVVVYATAVP
ncbi:class F sortase [Modestobacter sp. VKM Ac-2986]|uniref:class F sortase n=1 Tax=Modestobacter sp. VKM Ac-2986 TaxID=3004140 RepID=UPI0022ABA49C|nr:class F sortase [Modestobacter sp. VKM Ac-2986]MCZ2829561.1 class F sortase [Modestobacter sp. VKM Ac-2986]